MLSTLSGPGAGLGIDIRDGFKLAVKHSGGKLGGLPVEVIVADDQAKPDVGAPDRRPPGQADKVDFMTGMVFSNVMLAVGAPIFAVQDLLHQRQRRPLAVRRRAVQPLFLQRLLPERQHARGGGQDGAPTRASSAWR